MTYQLYHGDCLEVMKQIPDKSIDMILCDLPYGTTNCKWDIIIPFGVLWNHYERIIKDNGAIALHADEPFTALLITSNLPLYKYRWAWKKGKHPTGFLNAKKQPLRIIEDIVIFYKKQPNFNPQMTKGNPCHSKGKEAGKTKRFTENYNKYTSIQTKGDWKYPQNIIDLERDATKLHPTQKPVALCEYLIKTYTNEVETVLDNCMGSGSTGIAALNTGRYFIGIEKDDHYFEVAKKRIEEHQAKQSSQLMLLTV